MVTKKYSFVQADVALNLYDFWVRQPGKKHIKYGLRAYDEVILAPMVRGQTKNLYSLIDIFTSSFSINVLSTLNLSGTYYAGLAIPT